MTKPIYLGSIPDVMLSKRETPASCEASRLPLAALAITARGGKIKELEPRTNVQHYF